MIFVQEKPLRPFEDYVFSTRKSLGEIDSSQEFVKVVEIVVEECVRLDSLAKER